MFFLKHGVLCSWSAVDRIHRQSICVRLLLMIHYNAVNLSFYAADARIAKKLCVHWWTVLYS